MKKVGRNDTCACGSGKKNKKCCNQTGTQTRIHLYDASMRGFRNKVDPAALAVIQAYIQKVSKINIKELNIEASINFGIELIDVTVKYWETQSNLLMKGKSLMPHEMISWEGDRLRQYRETFRCISEILIGLPTTMMGNYETLLLPQGKFTRKTFEYFAGLMKVPALTYIGFIPPRPDVPLYTLGMHHHFINEYTERERIVEAALEETIFFEIHKIKDFLIFLSQNHQILNSNEATKGQYTVRYEFPGIYALTKRVIDTYNLQELSLLTADPKVEPIYLRHTVPANKIFSETSTTIEPILLPRNIETPDEFSNMRIFSLLGTLQRIGEMVTGKHLQAKIFLLDKSIDCELFEKIRNVISHQDESDKEECSNYEKIKFLMEDVALLRAVETEIVKLNAIILNLIALRYKNTKAIPPLRTQTEDAYKIFWSSVYVEENIQVSHSVQMKPVQIEKRWLTDAEIIAFKAGLKSEVKDLPIIDDIIYGRRFFSEIEKGEFMRDYFISKNEDRSSREASLRLFKDIPARKKAYDDTENKKISAEKERQKAELEALRGAQFPNIRALLLRLISPLGKKPELSNDQRLIKAAIFYLDEMRKLLLIVPGAFGSPEHMLAMREKLSTKRTFKFAFDYCAGQALTMICAAKSKIPAVAACVYFQTYGNELKDLRNWIKHGNAALDFTEEAFDLKNMESMMLTHDFRNDISYAVLAHLVEHLFPELQKVLLNISPATYAPMTINWVVLAESLSVLHKNGANALAGVPIPQEVCRPNI